MLCPRGLLKSSGYSTDSGLIMVKFLDKIAVIVARNERQGQVETVIVSSAKFELSRGQTTKLGIRSSGKGMID